MLTGCVGGSAEPLTIQYLYPKDVAIWERFFSVDDDFKSEIEEEVRGAVIPHHLIAAQYMGAFYDAIGRDDVPVVAVIGPNHFETAPEKLVQVCNNCRFDTAHGFVETDVELANKLVADGEAEILNETFENEHAMFAHTPFIKNFFPEAKILPIVTHWEIDYERSDSLAEWLIENLPEGSFVIASVDYSHYLKADLADFHDLSSWATVANFDFENLYDLEIDSPTSLYVVMRVMEEWGAMRAERIFHTNSQDFVSRFETETTSHHFVAFTEGDVEPVKGITVKMLGEKYENRVEGMITNFDGASNLAGEDDRFIAGADFLIGKVENGQCFDLEQNFIEAEVCVRGDEFVFGELGSVKIEEDIAGVWIGEDSFDVYQFSR